MGEKFTVPLVGSNVVPLAEAEAAGQYDVQRDIVRESTVSDAGFMAPEDRERAVGRDRKSSSLHKLRWGKSIASQLAPAELEPVWDEKFGKLAYNRRPVETPVDVPSPQQPTYESLQRDLIGLQQTVLNLTTGAHMPDSNNNQQAQGGDQAPNPLDYDLYDDESAAKFQADHSAYTQRQIEARVQATLAPHHEQIEQFKREREYDVCVEKFGDDPNFKQVMTAALHAVAADPSLTIQKAYQQADRPENARLGQRGNAHLPKQLKGVNGLGRIMAHNAQSGRARGRR